MSWTYLCEILRKIRCFFSKIGFTPNDDSFIDENKIGHILYSYDNILKRLGNPNWIDTDYKPVDAIELLDENILVRSSKEERFFELYDRDLKPMRRINKINDEDFEVYTIEPTEMN